MDDFSNNLEDRIAFMKKNIVEELNDKYGKMLLDLQRCKELQRKYQAKKEFILSELDIKNGKSSISQVLTKIDDIVRSIDNVLKESNSINHDINKQLKKVQEIRTTVQEFCDKINTFETAMQYMKVMQKIEGLSAELHKELQNKDDEKCVTIFANLSEICRNLVGSKAENLCDYLRKNMNHWHEILKEKLTKDFEEILKIIKWPFVNANFSLQVPSVTNMTKLQIIVEYLVQIQMPEETVAPVIRSALLSDFPPLSLPIHLLILPLRKRFMYHFYGNRQTNRIDKPEWYFTQILTWVRDHEDFLEKWIQPVFDKLGMHYIHAKLEFTRGLVQLAVEKLHSDLPNIQFDDFTFSHCIDEALGFDKELKETYFYPPSQPSILAVLTQASIFSKWLAMENKYATEKLDVMLSPTSEDAFQPISSELDQDNTKITICADTFVTLLQTMTERYEALPQPGHRIQFMELQLELLDDFRVRLLQIINAEPGDIIESKVPMIINTIYYVENVLIDWGSMLHYLNLYYYKNQVNNVDAKSSEYLDLEETLDCDFEVDSIFADTLALYRHMRKDNLCSLSETVVLEAKLRSQNYKNEMWSKMIRDKEFRSLSLTPSACPMFEVLGTRLHQLQKSLASKLFSIVWKYIAQQLDTFLFEDLVLDNRFSEGGALQLKYDVLRNLFPLFAQFSEKPENYFVQIYESCNLLNITKGSALLLRETLLALEGATGVEDRRGQALREVGVANFTPKMSVKILNQRTDITIDRLTID